MNHAITISSAITIGLDLGNRTSHAAILDRETGELVREEVATTPVAMADFLAHYPGARLVIEVGAHSRWVQKLAQDMDLNVINANPRQLALITRSQKKNDKKDALLLAQIGAGAPQILGHVQHRSPQAHADLAVIKTRAKLVRTRSEYVTAIRGLVKTVGVQIDACDATYFFRKAPAQIPAELSVACNPLIEMLTLLHEQILGLDKVLKKIAERYPAVDYLTQIDRVGTLTALSYVLIIEDPKRFSKNRTVGSYVGLTPRIKDSGDRTTQLGITKAGDTELRRHLCLVAHQILSSVGKDCALKRWGLELCKRGGKNAKKRAVCAVARKLSVLMLALWRSGETYDPMRGLPEEENA